MSTSKSYLLLLMIYIVTVADVVLGLNLNIYGWGREPFWFAFGIVAVASLMYRVQDAAIGMIALVLCCAWLLFYPAKNGFDVVLSPTLFLVIAAWLWQKFKRKQ
jgi:hypothetical protein